MSRRKKISIAVIVFALLYLLPGTVVFMRHLWWSDPQLAARAYLESLRKRDAVGIYLYADMLGPKLSGMMSKSALSEEQKKHLWAKDFVRWKAEFERGGESMDSLRRERELINPDAELDAIHPESYKAEVSKGDSLNMVTYSDDPGRTYHVYYQHSYPDPEKAPRVALLQNIGSGPGRKIESVIVRLEVSRRPEVGPLKATLLTWDWLEKFEFLYPVALFAGESDPSEIWGVKLSFNIDKLTLKTY